VLNSDVTADLTALVCRVTNRKPHSRRSSCTLAILESERLLRVIAYYSALILRPRLGLQAQVQTVQRTPPCLAEALPERRARKSMN
jgi:hypothetical protein